MNIIILTKRQGATKSLTLGSSWIIGSLLSVIALPVIAAVVTWQLATGDAERQLASNSALSYERIWEQSLQDYEVFGATIKEESQVQLEHMSQQLGRLQTRMSRLDALGERITELAELSDGEFDFNAEPGMGGPELDTNSEQYEGAGVQAVLDRLTAKVDDRTQQLRLLEELMLNRQTDANALLDFVPVEKAKISSHFGRRTDPITRRAAVHSGLDFSAPRGTAIYAVGAGVVTFSGRRGAYGNMIEISHAGGYKTRYAHAQELKVRKGDLVKKGELVATVGSSGRSTGPHLHLEVYRNGMAINPARFLALK